MLLIFFNSRCGLVCLPAEGSPQFPAAIHDMIDQSSYTIAVVDQLAGPHEPQARRPTPLASLAVSPPSTVQI